MTDADSDRSADGPSQALYWAWGLIIAGYVLGLEQGEWRCVAGQAVECLRTDIANLVFGIGAALVMGVNRFALFFSEQILAGWKAAAWAAVAACVLLFLTAFSTTGCVCP